MKDRIDSARIIFAEFQAGYELAPGRIWSIDFDSSRREKLGLSQQEAQAGIAVLASKHLIQMMGTRAYRLDDAGTQACIHPELLDNHLGPKHVAPPMQHITINAENMQNTQVGHNNTQNVSYSTVLESLREKVEAAEASSEDKQSAKELIDKLLRHPLTGTLVNLTVAGFSAGFR